MVVYEVNLQVQVAIVNQYLEWLDSHIAEILRLPGFTGAKVLRVPQEDTAETRSWCVQYELNSSEDLDNYLREHAPRLRAEGLKKFTNLFTAHRRVLTLEKNISRHTPT